MVGSGQSARIVLGGALLIVGTAQYLVAQVVTAVAWRPSYDWWQNSISDLGSTACGQLRLHRGSVYTCSPLHPIMNSAFVISGLLIIAGTALTWSWWPASRGRRRALGLWILVGVLKAVVGLVPENTVAALHLIGALNLPLSSVAILALSALGWRRRPATARLGLILGLVGLLGSALFLATTYGGVMVPAGTGFGGIERAIDLPADLWTVAFGVIAIHTARPRRFAPERSFA